MIAYGSQALGFHHRSGDDFAGAARVSPEGARHTSPGQRPGLGAHGCSALKGRDIRRPAAGIWCGHLSRPFRAGLTHPHHPGRCPGLVCDAPLGLNIPEGRDHNPGLAADCEVCGPHSGPYGLAPVGSAVRTSGLPSSRVAGFMIKAIPEDSN